MPIPSPKVPLKDHCSVIYANKLYTYQPDAFQSLDLKAGGEWTQLSMGVSTKGSACVLGIYDNQPALVIVGGSSKKDGYHGVQHYSFQDKRWKSDRPADKVAKNRLRHGAVFLQQSSQILTYGGSQDNEIGYTSQTFLISTKSPYSTQAYNSKAPPVTDPILLQYNTSHALLLGGERRNKKLFIFGPNDGWTELEESLRGEMQDRSTMQATILTGDDGAKLLEIFDMHDTPNSVSTVVLQNATSSNHKRSEYIKPHHPYKRRRRDAPFSDRPAYNNTLAPQDIRSGFSLASDPKMGLLVMSGGNEQSPIAMFNDTGNQWIDPNTFFSGAAFGSKPSPSPTPPSSAAPASPSTSASSAVPKDTDNAKHKSLTILGGTLGGVLGAAILLTIILLLLRYIRKRKERGRVQEEVCKTKEDMDFMDMGADFMREAGGSAAGSNRERNEFHNRAHKAHSRATSTMSKRALLHAKGDSNGSQKSFWSGRTKSPAPVQSVPQISAPIQTGPPSTRNIAAPSARNDTGWSSYFMDSQMPDTASRSNPPSNSEATSLPPYFSNGRSSSSYAPSNLHSSAEVEPLDFRPSQLYPPTGLGVALSHGVPRPFPPTEYSPTPSVVSDIEEESSYSNGPSNGPDSWSPVASSGGGDRNSAFTSSDHRISSNTNSESYGHPGDPVPVPIPDFPMPTSGSSSVVASPSTPQGEQPPLPQGTERRDRQHGLRNVVSRDLIRSNSVRQRAKDVVRTGTQRMNASTAGPTAQPYGLPSDQRKQEANSEDMSWLNLGTIAEQSRGFYVPGGPR